jgi:hypothetical protein
VEGHEKNKDKDRTKCTKRENIKVVGVNYK